jgi:hypothetical protein
MGTWRVRLLVDGQVQQWVGEAADGTEAEAKAQEAFPTGVVKSGSQIS